MNRAGSGVKGRASRWRTRADLVEKLANEQKLDKVDSAEIRGYVTALRECAAQLDHSIAVAGTRPRGWSCLPTDK